MNKPKIYKYEIYGLVIASAFPIQELNPCNEERAVDINIVFADLGLINPDAKVEVSFSEDRQVIILPAVGAFILDGMDTVLVERKPGVSDDFLAVPLLGPVIAISLHLRRKFILHGSAVVYNGKAYGFVGDKGAGKSTLAAMLLKNPGVDFLTDDLLVVESDNGLIRGYPQLKLSDEALANSDQSLGRVRPPPIDIFPKNQFLLNDHLPYDTVPIGGIFELRRDLDARVEDLSSADALRVLLRFSYMGRFQDRQVSSIERADTFSTTTALSSTGRVKRIFVPDRITDLDKVIDLLD